MASLIQSLINEKRAEVAIKEITDAFVRPVYSEFFTPRQVTDNIVKEIYQSSVVTQMAHVTDQFSAPPVHSLPGFGTGIISLMDMAGEYATRGADLVEKMKLREITQGIQGIEELELDYLMEKTALCVKSPQARLDYEFLQGISTGTLTFDTTNNPFGIVATIDLGFLTANKYVAETAVWGQSTSKPLSDIRRIQRASIAAGRRVRYMLAKQATIDKIAASTEFTGLWSNYFTTKLTVPSIDQINEVLAANGYPVFYKSLTQGREEPNIADTSFTKQTNDGQVTLTSPFSDNNVVFLPSLNVGELLWMQPYQYRFGYEGKMKTLVDNGTMVYHYTGEDYMPEDVWGYHACKIPSFKEKHAIRLLNTQSTTTF